MEDDGESFEINDRDLEYALDPTKRKGKRQTKEQQLYGVFYTGDDSDDERPGFELNQSKLSKGVSFVSGGVANDSKTKENNDVQPEKKPRMDDSFSSRSNMQQSFAGLRSSGPDWMHKSDKGSVIMNMMKKMGYVEGKGLGVKKQGRTDAIEVAMRPGRAAVGAYGREVSAIGPRVAEKETTTTETEEYIPRKGGWKKDKKNQKAKIKSFDDVIAGHEDDDDKDIINTMTTTTTTMKIIDMTGPEQKVYNDFQTYTKKTKIAEAEAEDRKKFDIPALTQNINLLADVTEEEIKRNDKQIKNMKDINKSLESDCQRLEKVIIDEKDEVKRLKEVLNLIEMFEKSENQNLNKCKELLLKLKNEYDVEYKIYGLESIALTAVLPILKKYFQNWDPLKLGQVDYGIDVIEEWKPILNTEKKEKKYIFDRMKSEMESLSAYDRCLWEIWMPPVRQAIFRWNVKNNSSAMLDLVLTWKSILPDWIMDNVLEQIIIPRIKEQVDIWDPTLDEISIETWLLPWHNILGDRLMLVYPIIRQKLSKALKNWIPIDTSALTVLKPFKDVFRKDTMASFLSINIIPKLEQTLFTMNLSPNYGYEEFNSVIVWLEMVNIEIMSRMLLKCFFSRWLEYIYGWLTTPGTVLNDVARYYKDWRDKFPPILSSLPAIKAEFQRGLNMISQAKQNQPIQLGPSLSVMPQPLQQPFITPQQPQNIPTTSLKEFIEIRAMSLGIIFMPIRNRFEQGKPVYQLGNIQILFDRDLLVVYNPHNRLWEPTNVDYAFELAGSGQ